jgi:hypothetical protein
MACRILLVLAAPAAFAAAGKPCDIWSDCDACAQAHSWMWGSECSWCPQDQQCHEFLSSVNPCPLNELVNEPKQCNGTRPTPPPENPIDANATKYVRGVIGALFRVLNITDADAQACAVDFAGATVFLKDFATDVSSKRYSDAMSDLSRGLTYLSRSTAGCNVPEVKAKIDALAKSASWARIIPVKAVDAGVKVFIDATDVWPALTALADAIKSNDPAAVGIKLGALISTWSAVSNGCGDSKECKLVDGLLRVLQVSLTDVKPCQQALTPVVTNLNGAVELFENKSYKRAVGMFAIALDNLTQATAADACGLKAVADAIGDLSASLKKAVVTIESSGVVKIAVGSANVYNEIFAAVVGIKRGDLAGAGVQVGLLLQQLKASGCESPACIITEGILGTFQEGLTDFKSCMGSGREIWAHFEDFFRSIAGKDWEKSFSQLGDIFGAIKPVVASCGVQSLDNILADTATRLHDETLALDLGKIMHFITNGADVTADMQTIIVDVADKDWAAVGKDIGRFADWANNTKRCNSVVCKVAEGVLEEVGVSLQDLKPCMATLREGEKAFAMGARFWSQGEDKNAVASWALGLNSLSTSVADCGLTQKLGWIEQEANVLGLANVTVIKDISQALVHGSDFYEELYAAFNDIMTNDYRSAGLKLAEVLNQLSSWTTGHSCTSPVCYVTNGLMQYLGEVQGDIKACAKDMSGAQSNFSAAFQHLSGHPSIFKAFSNSTYNLTQGMTELGNGLNKLADSARDCHLMELSEVLAALAAQLMLQPEYKWVGSFLHILIGGVSIERDVANVLLDFASHDWPGFGYNIGKLFKELIGHITVIDQSVSLYV